MVGKGEKPVKLEREFSFANVSQLCAFKCALQVFHGGSL